MTKRILPILFLFILLAVILFLTEKSPANKQDTANISPTEQINKHPPVTSNEDFHGERTNFTYSSNHKLIAFVQDVFEEYGENFDKYWALIVFDPLTKNEKILLVDDVHMSAFTWLNDRTIRVYHNAGTGVRTYADVSINNAATIFTADLETKNFWHVDEKYSQDVRDIIQVERLYYELTGKLRE